MVYANFICTVVAGTAIGVSAQTATAGQLVTSTGHPVASSVIVVTQLTYLDVIASLENTGYQIVDMRSTFLGRIKLRARNTAHLREVVVSRSTGEILSDVIVQVFGTNTAEGRAATTGSDRPSDGGSGLPDQIGGGVDLGPAGDVSVDVGGLGDTPDVNLGN